MQALRARARVYPLAALAARALVAGQAGRAGRAAVAALAARARRPFDNVTVTTRLTPQHHNIYI